MTSRQSPTFKFVADYIALPSLFLVIFVYCGLIFISRPYLGTLPVIVLIAFGIFAGALLGRGVIKAKKMERGS